MNGEGGARERERGHSVVVRSGLHALVLTASRMFAAGLGFLLHIVLARALGASDYGLYALGRSMLDVCNELSKFGFESTLLRYLPKRRIEVGMQGVVRVVATALAVASTLGAALSVLLYFFSPALSERVFHDAEIEGVLRGFAICVVPYALLGLSGAALRALERTRSYAFVHDVCFPGLQLACVGILAMSGLGVLGAVGAAFVASLTCALTMLALLVRIPGLSIHHVNARPRFDTEVLPFAVTMLVSTFAAALVMPASRLMLGAFETLEQVGLFNAAAVIAMQTSLVLTGANRAFAPIVAELHTVRDHATLALTYKRMTKWVVVATLPLCLVMVVFSAELLALFGQGFADAADLRVVLVAGQFVNVVTGSVGVVLIMTGRHRMELYNRWGMVAPVLVLNVVLIPIYGSMGAAIATSGALIAVNLVRLLEVYLLEGMHPFSTRLARTIAIAAIFLIAGIALHDRPELQAVPWPIQAVVLASGYFAAVIVWCLEAEDRAVIERVTRWLRART